MSCGFECYHIGGPWIAENPDCPIHGVAGKEKQRRHSGDRRAIHVILCDTWARYSNADEALDEIFKLIGDLYEC